MRTAYARKEAPARCLFLLLLSGFSMPSSAAPAIEELNVLDFGALAITGNNSKSTLQLPRSGRNLVIIGSMVLVAKGEPGRYRLTGFPPNTNIELDIGKATRIVSDSGIARPVSVHSYDTGRVRTNEAGEADFQLGAFFSTSGKGGSYEDATYKGSAEIRLYYWDSSVSKYVTESDKLDLRVKVRSSFALDESEPMMFGTLFAEGEPDKQASFRLFPDGRRKIENAGMARILSLSPPQPAILAISGAAPNRRLTIAVDEPATDIIMRHKNNPAGPHFILSDIETSPSSNGRTDDTGELEISVGATLKTEKRSPSFVYPAGTYEATYSVTVSY